MKRGMKRKDYKVVGTTYDGVRIIEPYTKSERFTPEEVKRMIVAAKKELGL